MAKLIGDLEPEDDYTHELGPEPNFNESMYFNFFDRERQVGGFVRLGNRANEGRAEMTVIVFLPDGRALFTFKRADITHNDAFDAGGLRFEVIEPTETLRTVYQGRVLELADPRSLSDPRHAFTHSPKRELTLDLEHRAVGPMYGGRASRSEQSRKPEQQFAKAHYEQHMEVRGTLTIDGEPQPIEGFGLRDHSWGPRYWQAIHGYEWLTLNFGADFGAMVSMIRREEGQEKAHGVVVRGDMLLRATDVKLRAEYEENDLYHRNVFVDLGLENGKTLAIEGTVRGFIPLRNRRDGLVTHIGEGMTEWRCNDRVGYGLSEFMRQVVT